MMLVVADTSRIHVLVRIDCIAILPRLFQGVTIPPTVENELRTAKYEVVRDFMSSCPDWLQVAIPTHVERIPRIHPGEEAAIALALEMNADALLIDDYDGRTAARKRGVPIVGTLGVLERAFQVGLIDLRQAIQEIRKTDFHVTEELLQSMLDRHYPERPG